MSATFGLVFPLWNMALDEHLLERALGEVGFDHVVVPAVTGPVSEFRRYQPLEPRRRFQTRGGWHYPFDRERYASLIAPPPKAEWVSKRDHLESVADATARAGVDLVLRVDVRGALAPWGDECYNNFQNAWDDVLRDGMPCVLDQHVRALLHATFDDLARYSPAGVELCEWQLDQLSASVGESTSGPRDRLLRQICFCPACTQCAERAGLDVDAVRQVVRIEHQRWAEIDAARHDSVEHTPWPDLLAASSKCRRVEAQHWIEQLGRRHAEWRRTLTRRQEYDADSVLWPEGWSRMVCVVGSAEAIMRDGARLGDDGDALSLRYGRPSHGDAAALVRSLEQAVRKGVRYFDFEGVAEGLPDEITWLKQAVRYARRGAE